MTQMQNPGTGQGFAGEKKGSGKPLLPPAGAQVKDENNTATAQRTRLLAALRRESFTTLEARRRFDVMHPAARIMELRRQGFNIDTVWTTDTTPEGNAHRVARYLLRQDGGGR